MQDSNNQPRIPTPSKESGSIDSDDYRCCAWAGAHCRRYVLVFLDGATAGATVPGTPLGQNSGTATNREPVGNLLLDATVVDIIPLSSCT